jgi:hypothetical protein
MSLIWLRVESGAPREASMKFRAIYAFTAGAIALSPGTATAASWSEVLCSTTPQSPLCASFQSPGRAKEDETITQLKALYLDRLEKWIANPNPTTAQEQVVRTCGMLTIISAPLDTASNFLKGDEREEFDARVDACSKLTVHRAWPQPEFSKPKTIDLVCNRWTPLLRELCIRAHLKT